MTRLLSTTAIAGVFIACFSSTMMAQTLNGKVTDATGKAPLQGAIISIKGLNRSATTDRFGAYKFGNIPEGTYDLSVSYIGTEPLNRQIIVPVNGITVNFTLGQDVHYLDNILVVGSRAAQAGAINQQRAADSIVSVIDSDGLGNFPDTTVADSLARVAGLSIETDQGEGRYVSIRGINTDLISTAINGVRTPSPEDRRGVLLDGVPSDLLDGIEVQKSLTPDVDGDSLGGVINLKTISAFDRKGRFVRAKLEGQYNEIAEEVSPKATLTYSNLLNDKFGYALSLNYQDLRIESHNNEAGSFAINDNGIGYMNDDYEMRWYNLTRERIGMVANFDWRLNENTDLYLRTLFNNYADDEVRNKFEFRDLDDVEKNGVITENGITLPLNEMDAEVRVRRETRQIQTIALGGKTQMDSWAFNYEVSYAYVDEDDSDNHDVTFRFKDVQDNFPGDITLDISSPQTPRLSGAQSVIDTIYDPENYGLDSLEREFSLNKDTEYGAKIDILRDSLIGQTSVTWKAGLKYRDREKIRDENFLFFEPDLDASTYTANHFFSGWRLGIPFLNFPDSVLTLPLRTQYNSANDSDYDEDSSFFDSAVADYTASEKVLAAYGMGRFDFGKLNLVTGLRVEKTDIDLTGQIVLEDTLTSTPRTISNSYTNILPSINAKYTFTDKLIGRAAYYAAVVRPAFGDMAPFTIINDNRDEAEIGNPALNPYEADNFDLSLEYYPTELSVISVGAFYKNIQDAIFPAQFDINNVPSSIDLVGIPSAFRNGDDKDSGEIKDITSFLNVKDSQIMGMEFNYIQDLGDLSKSLEGFLVSANLTLTDSESTLPDGRETPFLKQSDTVWNIALGYDKGDWDLRVSANYRDDYIDELVNENLDRMTDGRLLVEASAKYDMNDNIQIYLEGKNLTDEPEYYYFGNTRYLSQYDEFGSSIIFGMRLTY